MSVPQWASRPSSSKGPRTVPVEEDRLKTNQRIKQLLKDPSLLPQVETNPRLRMIHHRHAFQSTSGPGPSNERRYWEDAVAASMNVLLPENLVPRRLQHLVSPKVLPQTPEEEEQAYEQMMSDPKSAHERRTTPRVRKQNLLLTARLPRAPQPSPVQYSLRPGEVIEGSQSLQQAGMKFDEGHKERTITSYKALAQLWRDGGEEDPESPSMFFYQLARLKQHRFIDPRETEDSRPVSHSSASRASISARPQGIARTPTSTIKIGNSKALEVMVGQSIWKDRDKLSDSRSYVDTIECYEKAFALDWSRALRKHKLAAYILKFDVEGESDDEGERADDNAATGGSSASSDPAADSEILEVGNVLWKHHKLLYGVFDSYASSDGKGDISSVGYNSYKDFVQDCTLDVAGSQYCDSADYDRIFIQVNTKEIDGGGRRGKLEKLELTEASAGKHGMAVKTVQDDDDTRSLCRHEWFNCLVRMAIARYVLSGDVGDVSLAVERLLTQDVTPKLEPWILMDQDAFRKNVCYDPLVSNALAEHEKSLRTIFNFSADTDGIGNQEKLKTLISLKEWLDLLKQLRLLDDSFTMRDATTIFVTSRMRVINEKSKGAELKLNNLNREDFYEALVRVACVKALPTDAQIVEAECVDAGDFILKLRDDGDSEDEFYEAYYLKHGCDITAEPPQPQHRCVTHLLLLIIRNIESITPDQADLTISKNELKAWRQRTNVRGC